MSYISVSPGFGVADFFKKITQERYEDFTCSHNEFNSFPRTSRLKSVWLPGGILLNFDSNLKISSDSLMKISNAVSDIMLVLKLDKIPKENVKKTINYVNYRKIYEDFRRKTTSYKKKFI